MPEVQRVGVGSVRADNAGLGGELGEKQCRGEQSGESHFAGSVGFHGFGDGWSRVLGWQAQANYFIFI
jgi:hypothetical protein